MKLKTGGGFLETCGTEGQGMTDCVGFFFLVAKKSFFELNKTGIKLKELHTSDFTSNMKSCWQFAALQTSWPAARGGVPHM